MRAKEMIKTIRQVEHDLHGITSMNKSRIKYFQRKNWTIMKGVEYDSSFYAFVREFKQVMGSDVAEITAKKFLTIGIYGQRIIPRHLNKSTIWV